MQNRVGDNAPNMQRMAELVGMLQTVVEELRKMGVTLTAKERRRLLHARKGSEPMVDRVRGLAAKYKLEIPGIPLDGLRRDSELAAAVRPMEDLFAVGQQMATDTAAQAESEAWEAVLAYYALLTSLAGRLPELAIELRPVVEFMSTRRTEEPSEPPK